jgi:hypothetical protein
VSAQSEQKVHSKVQIMVSAESGGRSRSQHSQFGRISSIDELPVGSQHLVFKTLRPLASPLTQVGVALSMPPPQVAWRGFLRLFYI